VKEDATLVFSYVGFSKLEKAVTGCSDECCLSEEGGQNLNEVVTGSEQHQK
jgi:iron complex outermembrane receptor protein